MYSFFNLGSEWGGWSTPCPTPWPLYPREIPGTHCIGVWVVLTAGLDGCWISLLHRDSIPELNVTVPVPPTSLFAAFSAKGDLGCEVGALVFAVTYVSGEWCRRAVKKFCGLSVSPRFVLAIVILCWATVLHRSIDCLCQRVGVYVSLLVLWKFLEVLCEFGKLWTVRDKLCGWVTGHKSAAASLQIFHNSGVRTQIPSPLPTPSHITQTDNVELEEHPLRLSRDPS